MAQHEVYVAFSIHGSNAFITASKKMELARRPVFHQKMEIDGRRFVVGRSRTASENDAIKLLADDLMDGAVPTSDPKRVLAFFHSLQDHGWTVNEKTFTAKHKHVLIDYSRPAAEQPLMPETLPVAPAPQPDEPAPLQEAAEPSAEQPTASEDEPPFTAEDAKAELDKDYRDNDTAAQEAVESVEPVEDKPAE